MDNKIFTRKERLSGICTHREYFGQFVNNSIISIVKNSVGIARLKNSEDEHLNNIPLKKWDSLHELIIHSLNKDIVRKATEHKDKKSFPWSLSDSVCTAKEAGQQIKEAE